MVRYFSGPARPGRIAALDNMHRDRKRVFVDLRKWSVPVIDGQFEIDQFDNEHAVYLISASDEGEHHGSIRLLPTDRPHLLASLFPHLCDGPTPSGPDVWEITRACLSPRLRAAERLLVRNRLTSAVVQFALRQSLTRLVCVADSGWMSQILSLGWHCEPLGLPCMIGGASTGALQIHITDATLDLLRKAGNLETVRLTPGTLHAPLAA